MHRADGLFSAGDVDFAAIAASNGAITMMRPHGMPVGVAAP